jgi:3D (Asp-Asp-Asp) domain-containing protein
VLLAAPLWRKALVTGVTLLVFVGLYEVTILDSRYSLFPSYEDAPVPAPGVRMSFTATAYCKGLVTTSGVAAQNGVAAADPAVLPVGSVVQLDSPTEQHSGVYTVLDTGPAVEGRVIDVYMWSCHDALAFGRQAVKLTVLRLGWNPKATTPSFIDRFFKRAKRPSEPEPLPSRPLPIDPSAPKD